MKTGSLIFLAVLILMPTSFAAPSEGKLNFEIHQATLESVLKALSKSLGTEIQLSGDFSKKVNYSLKNVTAQEALDSIANDNGFVLAKIDEKSIKATMKGGRGLSSSNSEPEMGFHEYHLKFLDAVDAPTRLSKYLKDGEDIQSNSITNSFVLHGSRESYEKISSLLALLDQTPQQILIEAKIVETNDNFSRALALNLGDSTDTSLTNSSKVSGVTSTPIPNPLNFNFKYRLGTLDSKNLDLRLTAAEKNGNARIVSKPKVVTMNNKKANINSGITFNVKTLTTQATTSSTGTASGVSGGLQQVSAGLQLNVEPRIVGAETIRLLIDVNNSEPSSTVAVDGIPGVTNNSANTSIIIKEGRTAVIAGLIKNSKSKSISGVPILKDIPVLGFLFRSHAETDDNNELVIFITPRILKDPDEVESEKIEKVENNNENKNVEKELKESEAISKVSLKR